MILIMSQDEFSVRDHSLDPSSMSNSSSSQGSQGNSSSGGSSSQQGSQQGSRGMSGMWTQVLGQLFERLSGKEAVMVYEFDNLQIDVPRMQGPGGKEMGSGKWILNGTLRIKAGTEQHPPGKVI